MRVSGFVSCAVLGVVIGIFGIVGVPSQAFAISPGCLAAQGGAGPVTIGDGTATIMVLLPANDFEAGETLVFSVDGTASPGQAFVANGGLQGISGASDNVAAGGTTTLNYVVPNNANAAVFASTATGFFGGNFYDTFLVTCLEASASGVVGDEQRQSSANTTGRVTTTQTASLVSGRLNAIRRTDAGGRVGGPVGNTGASVRFQDNAQLLASTEVVRPSGLLDLSFGRDGSLSSRPESQEGMAAGGTVPKWGVWGSVNWTGIEDQTAVAGQEGNVLTFAAGADYAVSNQLIAGAALSLGGAAFDSSVSAFDTEEVSIGINPYVAYQITDELSVDGILGYQYARGESTRNETITGHYGIHRYYLAANASHFVSWDDFALLTSGGLLWGQSFEGAYTESDGTGVGSRRVSIGSTRILVQPSYLVELNAESGLFAEPYIIGEYNRDFAQTEISGHNNDPDAFRVGMGFNLFSGENLSGNLEGTTMLGREDQREINILGTVRYGF